MGRGGLHMACERRFSECWVAHLCVGRRPPVDEVRCREGGERRATNSGRLCGGGTARFTTAPQSRAAPGWMERPIGRSRAAARNPCAAAITPLQWVIRSLDEQGWARGEGGGEGVSICRVDMEASPPAVSCWVVPSVSSSTTRESRKITGCDEADADLAWRGEYRHVSSRLANHRTVEEQCCPLAAAAASSPSL